jgi:hypothetical protein
MLATVIAANADRAQWLFIAAFVVALLAALVLTYHIVAKKPEWRFSIVLWAVILCLITAGLVFQT